MSINALKFLKNAFGSDLTFGMAIAAIRKCDELTQTQFAKLLDISKQYLCDIENGRAGVTPKQAALFAQKLGYSEKAFVRLALQDAVSKLGMKFYVSLTESKSNVTLTKSA